VTGYSYSASLISGINNNDEEPEMILWPDPAHESINIGSLPAEKNFSGAIVLDVLGNSVWNGTVSEKKNIIDISGLPAGLYILKIKFADRIYFGKFIKD
jgi:hypothetical protein